MEIARRSSQSDLLTQCAGAIENAVVGVISLVLADDDRDKEVLAIRQSLLAHTHRLRQIAGELSAGKR